MAMLPQPPDDPLAMPTAMSMSPLLALPAELRNIIYEYVLVPSAPIRIYYRAHSEEEPRRVQFQRDPETENPANFFLSCKMINREAPSIYYSNNTFQFIRDRVVQICGRALVEIPAVFFGILGSQASWLQKIALDLEGFTEEDHYHTETNDWRCPVFRYRGPALFDVTPLLRAIWDLKLKVDVRMIERRDSLIPIGCGEAMTRVIRSILSGQLCLRQYGPQVTAVAVKHDGSGGSINWAGSKAYIRNTKLQLLPGPDSVDFIATNDGRQLCLGKTERQRNLLTLPEEIRRTIAILVLYNENMVLDLDHETSLKQGFADVNRNLYSEWRYAFFREQQYTLLMSTSNSHSTFSNFTKLRPLLRKVFPLRCQPRGQAPLCCIDGADTTIKLDFRLGQRTELADVRFNCLPFVMETARMGRLEEFFVRSWAPDSDDGHEVLVGEHHISFHDVRIKVVKAMIDVIFAGWNRCEPEIWIDGFGEVVEVISKPFQEYPRDDMPDTATKLTLGGHMRYANKINYYTFSDLHRRDRRFRPIADHIQCVFTDIDQFFPFTRSPPEILHYLTCILESCTPYRNHKFEEWKRKTTHW